MPIANAAVDIWQCNASASTATRPPSPRSARPTRGIQFTDKDGWAELETIYPGHYEGRATHVHIKLHIGGTRTKRYYSGGHVSHTGQMLFDEAVTDRVYATSSYSSSTVARVPNTEDRIYSEQGRSCSMPKLSGSTGKGFEGRISLGVNPRATPAGVGF